MRILAVLLRARRTMLVCGLAACSQGQTAATVRDNDLFFDEEVDLATPSENCRQILDCSHGCATGEPCIQICEQFAAPPAQATFAKLRACGVGVCMGTSVDGGVSACTDDADTSFTCSTCVYNAETSAACDNEYAVCQESP